MSPTLDTIQLYSISELKNINHEQTSKNKILSFGNSLF